MMGWIEAMLNARSMQLKRTMFQMLQERYQRNEQIIDRIGSQLTSENDITAFYKLLTDVYEAAYMKSVADHSQKLSEMGLVAKITKPGS